MNILLITGSLGYQFTANEKIMMQNADELAQMGHNVNVFGWADDARQKKAVNQEGKVRCYRIKREISQQLVLTKKSKTFEKANTMLAQYSEKFAQHRWKKIVLFSTRHPWYLLVIARYILPEHLQLRRQKKEKFRWFLNELQEVLDEVKPDAIIFSYLPYEYIEPAFNRLDLSRYKVYLYQMDPVGLHRITNSEGKQEIIDNEVNLIAQSNGLFTTPVLYRMYEQHPSYRPYIYKMHRLEFPNIRSVSPKPLTHIQMDKRKINIAFCGVLNDGYRNPGFFLEMVDHLIAEGVDICVYFFGTVETPTVMAYAEKLPNNIFVHRQVDLETANSIQNEADFLLNIGNHLDNQVPSKIFDYFSMGKPVINFQKIEDCPARHYFNKYPLCLTVEEWHYKDYKDAFTSFILQNKGSTLSYEQVESLYEMCTPKYVANKIMKIIEG